MEVVAEGVETNILREKLLELGCSIGQGYYFGKPQPICEIEQPAMVVPLRGQLA